MVKISRQTEKTLALFTPCRLLVLKELLDCNNSQCGCDLVEKLGVKKDLLSYHMKNLKGLGYVEEVKCSRKKNYSIVADKIDDVKTILKLTKII